jgi:hypothetical protein
MARCNQLDSAFLRLPTEIREIIYEYVFTCCWYPCAKEDYKRDRTVGKRWHKSAYESSSRGTGGDWNSEKPMVDLLLTCRQIHAETHLLPERFTTFAFYGSKPKEIWDWQKLQPAGLTSISFDVDVHFAMKIEDDWSINGKFSAVGVGSRIWKIFRKTRMPALECLHIRLVPTFSWNDDISRIPADVDAREEINEKAIDKDKATIEGRVQRLAMETELISVEESLRRDAEQAGIQLSVSLDPDWSKNKHRYLLAWGGYKRVPFGSKAQEYSSYRSADSLYLSTILRTWDEGQDVPVSDPALALLECDVPRRHVGAWRAEICRNGVLW